MIFLQNIGFNRIHWGAAAICCILIMLTCGEAKGQVEPPRPISVNVTQSLSFGSFYHGASGGSVIINSEGTRSQSGDVVLLNMTIYTSALIEVIANQGTLISFLKPSTALSDGNGHTLILQIADTNPASPFVTSASYPVPTQVSVGGVLSVANPVANPPGSYSGSFDIIFVQE